MAVAILDEPSGGLVVDQTDTVVLGSGLRLGSVHHLEEPQPGKQRREQTRHDHQQDGQANVARGLLGRAHGPATLIWGTTSSGRQTSTEGQTSSGGQTS